MAISDEIKKIKEAHGAAVIEKAKNEERLVSLNEQKGKIEQQSRALGVEPEQLGAEKTAIEVAIQSKLNEARTLLGLSRVQPGVEDVDAPF